MDSLLMAILVLDLYDAIILHYIPNRLSFGKHKAGALALLKHKGLANYRNFRSIGLAHATRHVFLDFKLTQRLPMPPDPEGFFLHPSLTESFDEKLDVLTMDIINTQARLWAFRRGQTTLSADVTPKQFHEELIAAAIVLDERLMAWRRAMRPEWDPIYVSRSEVRPSILEAGFFGEKCVVWHDLGFPEILNFYYFRRITTLQIIRQCFADQPLLLRESKYRSIVVQANSTIQSLVDAILETTPFHLGDTIVTTNPMYAAEISWPVATVTNALTGVVTQVPDLKNTDFAIRAAAAGGWMLFPHFVHLCRLAEPEDDAVPVLMKEEQLGFVKEQVARLQRIFMFADPVW
jgi:hypothetical protein